MQFFDDLQWRGLVHQSTDPALGAWLEQKPRTLYVGFDPTADSLHVGHMLGVMVLRRFQKAGHRPIAVVGGATGMIGDPSGKSAERNLLSKEQLQANVAGMAAQMRRFIDFDAGNSSALLVNNFDWTGPWSYLEFLRDVGKNFPVNVMLAKDSVKSRLGRGEGADPQAGMSYTEFSYMLLQAYDYVHLFDTYGCELQAGGSDQWGNITAGIDLGRRMRGAQLYGFTWPLLTKSDGSKMGKTESGAVWLSPERTSPYQFYQYWLNVDDADVGNCLRLLTELPQEEIEALDGLRAVNPGERESQRRLAEEMTKLVHGKEQLHAAQRATSVLFGAEIEDCDEHLLSQIFRHVPSKRLPRTQLTYGLLTIVDALFKAGLSSTKSEARRAVIQGAAYINNRRVKSIDYVINKSDLVGESTVVLRSGKKKYALLRFAQSKGYESLSQLSPDQLSSLLNEIDRQPFISYLSHAQIEQLLDSALSLFSDFEQIFEPGFCAIRVKGHRNVFADFASRIVPALESAERIFGTKALPSTFIEKITNPKQVLDVLFEMLCMGLFWTHYQVEYEPKSADGSVPDFKLLLPNGQKIYVECKSLIASDFESVFDRVQHQINQAVEDSVFVARNWERGFRTEVRLLQKPTTRDIEQISDLFKLILPYSANSPIQIGNSIELMLVPRSEPFSETLPHPIISIHSGTSPADNSHFDVCFVVYPWPRPNAQRERNLLRRARKKLIAIPSDTIGLICLEVGASSSLISEVSSLIEKEDFRSVPIVWLNPHQGGPPIIRDDAKHLIDRVVHPVSTAFEGSNWERQSSYYRKGNWRL